MKYSVKLSRRAYMNASLEIEANSKEEARAKIKDFLKGEAVVKNESDGQEAESVYDLVWNYSQLDENDDTEVLSVSEKN